jgi:hypothetical protein
MATIQENEPEQSQLEVLPDSQTLVNHDIATDESVTPTHVGDAADRNITVDGVGTTSTHVSLPGNPQDQNDSDENDSEGNDSEENDSEENDSEENDSEEEVTDHILVSSALTGE